MAPAVPGATAAAGQPRRRAALELALLGAVYTIYSLIRLVAGGEAVAAGDNARAILRLEELLRLDVERGWNAALGEVPGLDVLSAYWYATLHFTVTPALMVFVYVRRPAAYRRVRTALLVATLAALACYVTLPTAPPRLMPGYTDVLLSTAHAGWWSGDAAAVSGAGGAVNNFAAMPSMHVGWALWCGLVLWTLSGRRWMRVAAVIYPLGTTFVVIATANHWVLDVLAGAVVVGGAWMLTGSWCGRRTETESGSCDIPSPREMQLGDAPPTERPFADNNSV